MQTKCPVCGAPLEEGRCGYCGYADRVTIQENDSLNNSFKQTVPLQEQKSVINKPTLNNMEITPGVSRKSKTVALLLCIFSGLLGVHRFYVGKVGTGLLYLFTAGFFGIGWVIDIIRIATGSFKDEFDLPLLQ